MLPAQPVIAVIGAGSMGGVYAGFFAEAGYKVIVIDLWAEHIAAIHENGLRLSGVSGDRIITGITASTDIHAARDADLFIIATKASGVAVAARGIAAMFHSSQLVLTIQNGLGAADRIAAHMPVDQVLLGVAEGFGASIIGPGHIHHNNMRQIRMGEINGGITSRLSAVEALWQKAGFKATAFDDINQLIWEKYICNVMLSAPCTVFDCNIGELFANPEWKNIAIGAMLEAYHLGKARGISFSFDDPVAYATAFAEGMPKANPSMRLDHMAG
ncbi:MAG: 2-dehydropantoate 2-reductase, partial [Pseudomonadota bacterium]|nr:2-dehydropantoate 2-reductase [Pseudomonadota bacterium]